ncbi:MAG: bifunctional phosphopantothenoylcysteine decarboxylase/phosphopantothenate--cysteine ligase CoaBC [Chitinophagaceae bacterium]|nr:bifunctional phosphopantothenoylcysteine decarboxylase/phosphopantothenate--cysteine ligase CoaBC [Chitinophagaceae bacterium]MCW5925868.1 bifunctional phosphopantothenoylcysteine decarboxylase/phosphopantothenate--cysteine ligase CoaBC [Chitinophagaceae bacterium]
MTLKDKKIIVGITGSIAAYKSALLVRALVKEGAEVQVIMTQAAKDFISPLTLSTLSGKKVLSEIFEEDEWANHVMLGRWADIMVIAPLSCNTLAKMAGGLCDNLLLSVYLSAVCPVVVAPAMDEDMWKHPGTKKNLEKLLSWGNLVIPVGYGELASGLTGEGRMAEPESIVEFIAGSLSKSGPLKGKKALVTAGPTYEHLDPVRFIGNHSSGKMGVAVARELANRGTEVHLVLGPVSQHFDLNGLQVKRVQSAEEMFIACKEVFAGMDITVMAAAVADYAPAEYSQNKIKKNDDEMVVNLSKTPDILKSLGQMKTPAQVLVGFALETDNEEANAMKKLEAKNADMIVLNSLKDEKAGFGKDTNKVTVFDRKGGKKAFDTKSKEAVAKDIIDCIIGYTNA